MEKILSLLHTDIIKFKDIFSILIKLEQDGIINDMCNLFQKVFSSEANFAIDELSQIQNETEGKINMSKQFENNLTLFKSNFHIISQVLIENTFKVILQEGQNRLKGTKPKPQLHQDHYDLQVIEERASHGSTPKNSEKYSNDSPQVLKFKLDNTRTSQANERKSSKTENNRSSKTLKSSLALHKIVGAGERTSQTARTYTEAASRYYDEESLRMSARSINRSTSGIEKISPRSGLQDPLRAMKASTGVTSNHSGLYEKSKKKCFDLNRDLSGTTYSYYDSSEKSSANSMKKSSNPVIGKTMSKNWVDFYAKNSSIGSGQSYPPAYYSAR